MFRNKKELDSHVADIMRKIVKEKERNLRGYSIAKLYYQFKEYETAKRYLASFLTVQCSNALAHKLLAQIYEGLGQLEMALQTYRHCLELDQNQKDVVLKVCELYCTLPVDPDRARYWADRAEQLSPHSDVVFRLRECIVNADGNQNVTELENLIKSELSSKPHDVKLRVKLVKLLLDSERVNEAFQHVTDVEKQRFYADSIEWNYCVVDVCEVYLEENSSLCNQEFYQLLLSVLDRLVYLSLEEKHGNETLNGNVIVQSRSTGDCAAILTQFDKHLYAATKLVDAPEEPWKSFLHHMIGQFYLYTADLILKRTKKDYGNIKDAARQAAALLVAAYSFEPPQILSSWYAQATAEKQQVYKSWYSSGCLRMSQAGHTVRAMCQEEKTKWLLRIKQQVCTTQSRERIYQRACGTRDIRQATSTSFFLNDSTLVNLTPEFPDENSLALYDKEAHILYPDNLHNVVWYGLQRFLQMASPNQPQPKYDLRMFSGLQHSTPHTTTGAIETLCMLDIEAFYYATIRVTSQRISDKYNNTYAPIETLHRLPVIISDWLCTQQQANWWSAAYNLYHNRVKENLGQLRLVLQRGIETVRCLQNHGMNINLVLSLAESFSEQAHELRQRQAGDGASNMEKVAALIERAAMYWKVAVDMLERLAGNQTVKVPKECMFEVVGQELSTEQVGKLLEKGKLFLASRSLSLGKYEQAIKSLECLRSADASFNQAQAYKKLASEEFENKPRESITSEMRSRHIILLTRARDALYVTLDRVQGDKHPLNKVLYGEIEDIETKLAQIKPDAAHRQEQESATDESISSRGSDDVVKDQRHSTPHQQNRARNHEVQIQSTPSRHQMEQQSRNHDPPLLSNNLLTPTRHQTIDRCGV